MATEKATLEELADQWPHGSISFNRTGGWKNWTVYLHRYGACVSRTAETPSEALARALVEAAEQWPDEATAKQKMLAEARARLAQLEADLAA